VRIGVDLGGSKIEVVALDRKGAVSMRRRAPTPSGDYAAIVAMVATLVRAVEAEIGRVAGVGIGIPGTISPTSGRVKNANTVCLIGHPLDRDLAAALGRPVRLANDANCFALSEATDGAGRDAETVFGVILGTGVGGGLVIGGRIVEGINAVAGEWGHNPLPWPGDDESPGDLCYCGKHGCIETFLSGPGLSRDHARAAGLTLTPSEIAKRAEDGDAAARATMDRYCDRLSRALATVINIVDPEVIVLGGGLSNIRRLYDSVATRLPRHVFSDAVTTRLVPPRHGDSSGVRGAAWLWPDGGAGR